MSYTHLTPNQRLLLSGYLRAGLKQVEIAELLNKHPSTISRELKRNASSNIFGYHAGKAKRMTQNRRLAANQRFRKIDQGSSLENYIILKLKELWSPQQIAGRLKLLNDGECLISHETIYSWIYKQKPDLKKYLRCQKGKYRRRYGTKIRERRREEAKIKRIDQRPLVVEKRKRVGDWEGDTVVSKGGSPKGALLTHVDRLSGLLLVDKLKRATKEEVSTKAIERFSRLDKTQRLTITYDNGTEFSAHNRIEKELGIDIYFAYPYHSWERGSNENANGLLRQFFPKKKSLENVTQEKVNEAVENINNRPRKRFNYLTPKEVFEKNCTLV
jgi:transposase, IS30 family